jgi:hypothetical protein
LRQSSFDIFDTNMFLALGKYVLRQNENLLTQAFTALFNHSTSFRYAFLKLILPENKLNANDVRAFTQKAHSLSDRSRIIVDSELWCIPRISSQHRIAVIEAKLESKLHHKQAAAYAKLLKKRSSRTSLIIITKYGILDDIVRMLPRNTLWLTWSHVAELLNSCRTSTNTDRFLSEEFIQMLKYFNIPMLPPLTKDQWARLSLINKFVTSSKDKLHIDSVDAMQLTLHRLVTHRDAAWSSLALDGWKPYAKVYVEEEESRNKKKAYVNVEVGFYRLYPKNSITQRYLCIGINCKNKPQMYIWGGWNLRKDHPDYGKDNWQVILHQWTPDRSRSIFSKSIQEALSQLTPNMKYSLVKFKRTKYFV